MFVLVVFFINFLNIILLLLLGYNKPPDIKNNSDTLPYEIILIAPFVEEMFFRFPLKKGKGFLLIFITFLISFLLMKFNILNENVVYAIFTIIFLYLVNITHKSEFKENDYKNKRLLFLTLFLSLAFGLSHLLNYEELGNEGVTYLLIFSISKIISGLILSVIRLRYGIIISILFHCLLNFLIFALK
jgi:hypothetical protein